MTLAERRIRFTRMLRILSAHIDCQGLYHAMNEIKREPTFCSTCRKETTHGHSSSLHRVGLAVDILLYDMRYNYLIDDKYYEPLHDFWDSLGGAKRIPGDLNHFAYPYAGML